MQGNFARGAGYLTRGARLLTHPTLRAFVVIPLVINILIFGSLIGVGFSYINDLMDSIMGEQSKATNIRDEVDAFFRDLAKMSVADCALVCSEELVLTGKH